MDSSKRLSRSRMVFPASSLMAGFWMISIWPRYKLSLINSQQSFQGTELVRNLLSISGICKRRRFLIILKRCSRSCIYQNCLCCDSLRRFFSAFSWSVVGRRLSHISSNSQKLLRAEATSEQSQATEG